MDTNGFDLRKPIAPIAALLILASCFAAPASRAEFYLGGSVGTASIETELDDVEFDEDDFAWKAFGGYIFDLPVIDFSLEAGYLDFGTPSNATSLIDATAIDVFGVVGFDFGIVGVFGKAGAIAWDADYSEAGFDYSDDGTDPAYGVGVRFNIASLFLRVEYERFDIEETDAADLLSAGVVWRF